MTSAASGGRAIGVAAIRAMTVLGVVAAHMALWPLSAFACIWDRDTLSAEAIGLPEVIDVIVGRFDRVPTRFYEIRLGTVTGQLRREPDRWDLYDDAGAAADRLHRGDEAIAWMERKLLSLQRAATTHPDHKEHTYRYHANLGTFYAHRWLRSGAKRDRLGDLASAKKHIAEAIRINPQAHFGRERYQLMAIEWLLESPDPQKDSRATSLFWVVRDRLGPDLLGKPGANKLSAAGYGDAVRGLTGLIVLGDAWQSVDIHLALAQALNDQGNIAAASLAVFKMRKLLETGRRSLLDGNDSDRFELVASHLMENNPYVSLPSFYREATTAAENRDLYRDTYIRERLDAGRHPDSDAGFWKDYAEPPALRLQVKERPKERAAFIIGALISVFAVVPLFVLWLKRRKTVEAAENGSSDERGERSIGVANAVAIILWGGFWTMQEFPADRGMGLLTYLLYLCAPLLLALFWRIGHQVMRFPSWTIRAALRHLGTASMLMIGLVVVLIATTQRPNYHVEWKKEAVSLPTIYIFPLRGNHTQT